jgi:hypothetical protein
VAQQQQAALPPNLRTYLAAIIEGGGGRRGGWKTTAVAATLMAGDWGVDGATVNRVMLIVPLLNSSISILVLRCLDLVLRCLEQKRK